MSVFHFGYSFVMSFRAESSERGIFRLDQWKDSSSKTRRNDNCELFVKDNFRLMNYALI
jgi:hypothetical protein